MDKAIRTLFPADASARKETPIYSGALRYFPAAIAGVARCSVAGSRQHHGSAELFHDRSKSADEADAMLRHLLESEAGDGTDTDGVLHIDKFAWRALSIAQKYHERRNAPIAPAARNVPAYGELIPHTLAAEILRDRAMSDDDTPTAYDAHIGAQSFNPISQSDEE